MERKWQFNSKKILLHQQNRLCTGSLRIMKLKILIVEDQFIEANNLRLILDRAGYMVLPIAPSFVDAMEMLDRHKPEMVLLDILLNGTLTVIDFAKFLSGRNIPFVYLTANS